MPLTPKEIKDLSRVREESGDMGYWLGDGLMFSTPIPGFRCDGYKKIICILQFLYFIF